MKVKIDFINENVTVIKNATHLTIDGMTMIVAFDVALEHRTNEFDLNDVAWINVHRFGREDK